MRSKWLRILLGIVVALVAVYVILALLARPAAEHPFFAQFEHHPLVMAHQGGNGLWPDNTQYAFERAVALGVDVLEMDTHSTADGVLVVSEAGRTRQGPLKRALLILEQAGANVLGAVLNRAPKRSWRGQYYYYQYYTTDQTERQRRRKRRRRVRIPMPEDTPSPALGD